MLSAVETFFSGMGIILFASGLILCCIRKIRRGIVLMLIGDVCFLFAILYPKKISEFLQSMGVDKSSLKSDCLILGLCAGVAAMLLLQALSLFCVKYAGVHDVKRQLEKKESAKADNDFSGRIADPKLFANVRKKSSS